MLKTPLKTLVDALINRFTKERLETLILQNDEKLLTFMLEHENANDYKNAFFKMIANSLVFNQKALLECLTKELENSFTRFENKIGLYSQGRPIKSSELVVLNFPFKDNVLLGNAKDNSTKSNECFYHEILHKKEIDTLLNKKALCHFEMHGEGDLQSALKDKNTNYLIKGNNLIALHSLKKKFAKQVKCIYIDPPYNTGNDSFNYNDNFNHSSWLVFMKNRLEAAREFLSDDGSIYINLDYNEVHYCKVLMDEIFGVENFQREIIWRIGWLSGYKTSINNFIRNHDTILFYSKNADKLFFNKKYIENKDFKELIKIEKIQSNLDNLGIDREKQKNIIKIINHETRPERYPLEDIWNGNEYDDLNSIAIVSYSGETVSKMLGTEEIKGQKSEKLIQRILEVSTNENDLVLDFFAGSGTTCAVAHKMKRRYIGIEQMDYIETITKERLKKVIEGEQGGISKKCGFKGGGSFVYAELKEVNLEIKKQILNAKSKGECLKIFNDLSERFLKRADCKTDEIHSEEFQKLDLNEQKRIYCALLDSNEDYLNLGDIDEDTWGIDEITKKYNEIFYS
ncbi:site-specific DNA-methyltransferase [Helicobacter pylori]|uniref:site-specific DNA-methyltransferase n=1 Tax=Helicobacter pylori TaxID=210 RepID=UPI000FDEBE40|nr:site-specific DNA-methyltransferase [Helicobacter pylori]RVZ13695.1 site-specific DNA-methyltransferase [Helicobacter pylori]WQW93498.1 site-specific DNA-methyltransferase [Helicobacter pylori]